MVTNMSNKSNNKNNNHHHHSGNNSLPRRAQSGSGNRSYFKGYIVKVADTGITFTRNFSPLGKREREKEQRLGKSPLQSSFQRSATVLPIVSNKTSEQNSNNSSNSTFSGQDVIQGIPPGTSSTTAATSTTTTTTNGHSSDGSHQMSSDDLKHFERKLEREREKRIHTDPPPNTSRVESRVLSDNIPQFDFNMRRSGFRPANKNSFMTRGEQSMHLAAFRHAHHPTPQELSITSSGAPVAPSASTGGGGVSGALRGQSIGFGSRDGGSSGVGGGGGGLNMGSQGRGGASKTRSRVLLLAGQSDKYKQTQYQFPDPASGATPDFQQRLNEITALESDTIRYERTKKAKKKSKQDSG